MTRPIAKQPDREPFIGRRIRIRCEAEVIGHYAAGPTAPERVQVKVGGIITIVPVANVEVLP
jgi:hypothetical protein